MVQVLRLGIKPGVAASRSVASERGAPVLPLRYAAGCPQQM